MRCHSNPEGSRVTIGSLVHLFSAILCLSEGTLLNYRTNSEEDVLHVCDFPGTDKSLTPAVIIQCIFVISVINPNKLLSLRWLFGIHAVFILLLVKILSFFGVCCMTGVKDDKLFTSVSLDISLSSVILGDREEHCSINFWLSAGR